MRLSIISLLIFLLAAGCGADEEKSDSGYTSILRGHGSDGAGDSGATNGDVNTPPIADAGVSQSLSADEPVLLSGTGSFDPDGDPLSYTWAFDSVPVGSSMGATSFSVNESTDTNTTFVPDTIGTYVVQLVVTDSRGAESPPDWTLIEVEGGEAPTADAGANQNGLTGDKDRKY